MIDPFLGKVEEWVDRSKGHVRADVVHERLAAVGFDGDERTTRRAVAEAKARWRAGHQRTYRPWITEPGMWCQFDWGVGPVVPWAGGAPRTTLLFCLWLAWSRFRVVIPTWDRTLPTLLACIDTSLRRLGGAPTYALTDNEKTVTVEHVARVAVRHPEVVAAGRHYGLQVATCVPFDPESKGGAEASVRIAKADLVPTEANLAEAYADMTALVAACDTFCATVNARPHRETGAVPIERLAVERARLHVLPSAPYAAALGETRLVNTDQTVRFGRCATRPHRGWSGPRCGFAPPPTSWSSSPTSTLCHCARGGHPRRRPGWSRWPATPCPPRGGRGSSWATIRAPPSPSGAPRPPTPKPTSPAETAFLALGPGAEAWLVEAAAAGAVRVRAKMAAAVELAALAGRAEVDAALGVAAAAGRFAEDDLLAITTHRAAGAPTAQLVVADETHSAQPGTSAWEGFGR